MQESTEVKASQRTLLKSADIVNQLKAKHPRLLANLDEKTVAKLVQVAMRQIASSIADTEQGLVRVNGLGDFRVRQINQEKDGQMISGSRVIFKLATKKEKDQNQTSNEQSSN